MQCDYTVHGTGIGFIVRKHHLQTEVPYVTYANSDCFVIKVINIATPNPHERRMRKWSVTSFRFRPTERLEAMVVLG